MEDTAHKGHEGEDGFDPHIWTSPLNAFKIAEISTGARLRKPRRSRNLQEKLSGTAEKHNKTGRGVMGKVKVSRG